MTEKTIQPIAYIENDFKEKFGVPRQSGRAYSVLSRIVFYPKYRIKDAFRGIEGFSHLWLIFDFSEVKNYTFTPLIRPPRLGGNKKAGVFASRSPFRPNGLGLSSVKLIKIEDTKDYGITLVVSGADLIDKTPIYDIKPYIPSSDCHENARGGFSDNFTDYSLKVDFPENLKNKIDSEKLKGLIECLSDDPRPSYIDDESRIYGMSYGDKNIKFKVIKDTLFVIDIE